MIVILISGVAMVAKRDGSMPRRQSFFIGCLQDVFETGDESFKGCCPSMTSEFRNATSPSACTDNGLASKPFEDFE